MTTRETSKFENAILFHAADTSFSLNVSTEVLDL